MWFNIARFVELIVRQYMPLDQISLHQCHAVFFVYNYQRFLCKVLYFFMNYKGKCSCCLCIYEKSLNINHGREL